MWTSSAIRKIWKKSLESAIRSRNASSAKATVDVEEVRHFEKSAADWWNESGDLGPLHSLNKVRIPLIRDGILATSQTNPSSVNPLKGIKILDVGCGGGILTEPLARLSGTVTGIDAAPGVIEMAKSHAEKQNLEIDYQCMSVEDFARENPEGVDAVVASEILEHVTNKEEFLKACVECLKPGGSIFITTLNKTLAANCLGIFVAERVLGLVPIGTHQYEKFISPHQLQRMLLDLDTRTVLTQGLFYNFANNEWSWTKDHPINYALHGIKNDH